MLGSPRSGGALTAMRVIALAASANKRAAEIRCGCRAGRRRNSILIDGPLAVWVQNRAIDLNRPLTLYEFHRSLSRAQHVADDGAGALRKLLEVLSSTRVASSLRSQT